MKKYRIGVISFIIICLILCTRNFVAAAQWTYVGEGEMPVGYRFQYKNIYGVQNYMFTTKFTLSDGNESRQAYCIQQRVHTEKGVVYNLEEYGIDNLGMSVSELAAQNVENYAYHDGGNTGWNYYMNHLDDTIRRSLNVAFMWQRIYHPNDESAITAAQWFIWCQTYGYASDFMDDYRDAGEDSKIIKENGQVLKIHDGWKYLDVNYGIIQNDSDNNGILSSLGIGKVPHSWEGKISYWDNDFVYASLNKYVELVNYWNNFNINEEPNFVIQNGEDNVLTPGETLTITDTNGVINKKEWVLNTNVAEGITAQKSGNNIIITVSDEFKGSFDGSVLLTRFGNDDNTGIRLYSNGERQVLFEGDLPEKEATFAIKAISNKIRITKADSETGAVLQGDATLVGAQYEVKKSDNTYSTILTIGDNLQAETDWLSIGTYYIKEIQAPNGYNLSDVVYTVNVTTDSPTIYIDQTVNDDVIKGNIVINKKLASTDYDEEINLVGAKFKATLKSDTSKVYYSNISAENGICKIENLPYGTYEIEESIVPDNALKLENFEVSITENGKDYTFEKVDTSKSVVLKIRKVDANKKDTDAPDYSQGDATLEGAQYTIYSDEDLTNIVDILTIDHKDEEGYWCGQSGKIRTGTYYVKETKASKGYMLDENVYVYEQDNSLQTEEVVYLTNTSSEEVMRGSVSVIKFDNNLDGTDEKPAEGAVLRLTLDSDTTKYYELEINEDGYGEFIEEESKEKYYPYTIPYGTYTITEIKASNAGEHTHFYFTPEKIKITKNAQKEYRIFSDEPVKMYLTIEKIDKDTDSIVSLAGAKYKIWNCQTNSWVSQKIYPSGKYIDEFETNEEGKLTLPDKIEAGEYVIYETQAPKGYFLNKELRIPENESDLGDATKGGKYIKIDKSAMGIEEDSTPDRQDLYYKVEILNTPLKAKLEILKTGEKLSDVSIDSTEYGEKYTPVYKNEGLEGVTYNIIAAEDIKSSDENEIYVKKGSVVDTITTNENGIATTKDLYLGEYEIVEIVTPVGYIKEDNIENVILKNENSLVEVETTNKELNNIRQKLKISFEKEYKDVEYLNNENQEFWSVFGVYSNEEIKNSDGTVVIAKDSLMDVITIEGEEEFVTSNIDLPAGKYYVKELDTAFPYTINLEKKEVELKYIANNQEFITTQLDEFINDYEKGSITLIKVSTSSSEDLTLVGNKVDTTTLDAKVNQMLEEIKGMTEEEVEDYFAEKEIKFVPGAIYKIYTDSECTQPLKQKVGEEYQEVELVTTESGIIKLKDIPLGKYYLKEIKAPKGYELSEDVVEIELTREDKGTMVYKAILEEVTKSQLITKTDIFTGEVIPNCTFEIKDENGKILLYSKTNEEGEGYIPVDIFVNGKTYTYTEIDAPDIYNLNEEPHEFVAKFDEEGNWLTEKIAVENTRKESTVTLEKLDFAASTPIPNCKFELRSLETDFVVEGVTDENGIYVFENIPYGKYTYTELEAPEEYIIDTEAHEVTIDAEEMKLQITNEKIPETGDIQVVALAIILVMSIAGISFRLKNKRIDN